MSPRSRHDVGGGGNKARARRGGNRLAASCPASYVGSMLIRFAPRRARRIATLAGVAGVAAVVACAGAESPPPADTAGPSVTAAAPGGAGVPAAAGIDSCPRFGAWQVCSVEKRLRDAGLVVERADTPPPEGIAPGEGIAYDLGPAELVVWLYPTVAERERASAALDSSTAQPKGSARRWPRPATLIISGNLLAVLQSENERTTERVMLALTAGLPPK
jgi:hypothetical protein